MESAKREDENQRQRGFRPERHPILSDKRPHTAKLWGSEEYGRATNLDLQAFTPGHTLTRNVQKQRKVLPVGSLPNFQFPPASKKEKSTVTSACSFSCTIWSFSVGRALRSPKLRRSFVERLYKLQSQISCAILAQLHAARCCC